MQAAVHSCSVIDGVSHVFEVFKNEYRVVELRDPTIHVTRYFVEVVVNEVSFFRADNSLERGLADFLHSLTLREELVANTLDVRVLNDHRVQHIACVSTHRGESHTIFVDVHANHCFRVVWRRY